MCGNKTGAWHGFLPSERGAGRCRELYRVQSPATVTGGESHYFLQCRVNDSSPILPGQHDAGRARGLPARSRPVRNHALTHQARLRTPGTLTPGWPHAYSPFRFFHCQDKGLQPLLLPRNRPLLLRDKMNQEVQNTLTLLASDLHAGAREVSCVTPLFGAQGLLRLGLPDSLGGHGEFWQAVRAIADVARLSLTGAFALWGQRAVIELVAQGTSAWLHRQVLPDLLQGTLAAAPGLSNAMKSLSGIEGFQLQAEPGAKGLSIQGRLPWVSNLQPAGFVVAAVARTATGRPVAFLAPATAPGLTRSAYFELMGLQGSATAAVTFAQVTLEEQWLLHVDARLLLPRIRPAFLLLQCGLPLGLGQRALAVAQAALPAGHLLQGRLDNLLHRWQELEAQCRWLCERKEDPALVSQLFRLRIDLTQLAVDAVFLELQAVGGRAFAAGSETSRHVSEAAFLPLVTPTVAHLEAELQKFSRQNATSSRPPANQPS